MKMMKAKGKFSIFFSHLLLGFLFVSLFSCPGGKTKNTELYQDCHLTIRYSYNDYSDGSGIVREGTITRTLYKGSVIGNDLSEFSNQKWQPNGNPDLGYGYETETQKYVFIPNGDGVYEFKTSTGKIWTTKDPLPAADDFVLVPNYVAQSQLRRVKLHFTKNIGAGYSISSEEFQLSLKHGDKLSNVKGGTPEGWTDGNYTRGSNGRYEYSTGNNQSYYLKSSQISSTTEIFYFTVGSVNGAEFSSNQPVVNDLDLYAIYLDASLITITINYKISDGEYGQIPKSFSCDIKKGESLKSYFGTEYPKYWAENGFSSWKPFGNTVLGKGNGANEGKESYEFTVLDRNNSSQCIRHKLTTKYIVTNNVGENKFLFSKVENSSSGSQNDVYPDTPLYESTTIWAQYTQTVFAISKMLTICYSVDINSQNYNGSNYRYYVIPFYNDRTNNARTDNLENFEFDVESIIPLHADVSEVGKIKYGYIDSYHGDCPVYYYDKTYDRNGEGTFYFKDGDDNTYTNVVNLNNLTTEEKIILPKYIPAGYRPITMPICPGVNLQFVYIPNSQTRSTSDILGTWPYTQYKTADVISSHSSSYNDEYDGSYRAGGSNTYNKHIIYDMFFGQTIIDQKDVKAIINAAKNIKDNDGNQKYNFTQKAIDTEFGLKYSSEKYVPWNYLTYKDAMVFCNLLTELYNMTNSTGYDLTYVTEIGNTRYPYTNANDSYTTIIAQTNNALFRIPLLNEWEYASRIITDERQLPDDKKFLLAPRAGSGDPENPRTYNYYQSASKDTSAYYGSGAGLAYYSNSTGFYDRTRLRTGAEAIGHSDPIGGGTSGSITFNASVRQKIDSNGEINYNLRNGAGLYNMHGLMGQLTATRGTDISQAVVKGGVFRLSSNSEKNRIGYIETISKSRPNDSELEQTGLRLMFYYP